MPTLWHCFSSTVIVPRNRSTPPSLLATSAPVQNPKVTALAESGEQLGHHHPLQLPFQRSTDISLEAVGNIKKLMHPSALPAGSCKQEPNC